MKPRAFRARRTGLALVQTNCERLSAQSSGFHTGCFPREQEGVLFRAQYADLGEPKTRWKSEIKNPALECAQTPALAHMVSTSPQNGGTLGVTKHRVHCSGTGSIIQTLSHRRA